MFGDRNATTRTIAATIAAVILVAATPQAASAEVDNIWTIWASEVTDRQMAEIPFVILTSLPAMILSTPFWAGVVAVDAYKHRGAEEDDEAGDETSDDDDQ
jgi:hypothetical protein